MDEKDKIFFQVTNNKFWILEQRLDKEQVFLFSWDETPRNDSGRLIDFLKQKYSIDWVKTAKIEKIDDGKTIKVSVGKNHLSLSLNNEKNKVNLKIDDGRTDDFIAKMENGKLNICDQTSNPAEPDKEDQASNKHKKKQGDASKPATDDKYNVNAWVFNDEISAIKKFKDLITADKELTTAEGKVDLDKIEKMGEKYNLQEVEIAKDKYNMKSISWLKVALLGFVEK